MRRGGYWIAIIAIALILIAGAALGSRIDPDILEEFKDKNSVPVIITLKEDPDIRKNEEMVFVKISADKQEARLSLKKAKISEKQERFLEVINKNRLAAAAGKADQWELKHKYATASALSGKITLEGLEQIRNSPLVESITLDKKVKITLDQSVPQINADQVWGLQIEGINITGAGETVCVVDTGVDYTHPALGNCSLVRNSFSGNTEDYSLESTHPYANSTTYNYTVTRAGFSRIAAHFSNISTEADYDFIKVYDGEDKILAVYSGSHTDVWTPSAEGDTLHIKLIADESVDGYGFVIDKVINGTVNTTYDWSNCSKVIGGWDMINSDADPKDDNSHGTHVAGIIISDNSTYSGVAPEAKIVALKVLDSGGSGTYSSVAAGVDWCINRSSDYNISVISMSLGCEGSCTRWQSSCDEHYPAMAELFINARELGIIVAVAAGNFHWTDGITDPACISNATPVGAVTDADAITYNRGNLLSLLAPGINTYSTVLSENWQDKSGTSMSTPHLAGAAVLLQQYSKLKNNLTLPPEEIENILRQTGAAIDDSGGSGLIFKRIDVLNAVQSIPSINISAKTVYTDHGKIIFSGNTDYNYAASCILIRNNSIFINSSACPQFDEPAQLMLYGLSYEKNPLILKDGEICSECEVISYAEGNLSFNVAGFSNYSSGENSQLSVWDSTDSIIKRRDEQAYFYANYTNRTSGEPINGSCLISFGLSPEGPFNMTFNSTFFVYNRSFSADGNHSWNVSCSSADFENLSSSDIAAIINNTLPSAQNVTISSDDGQNGTNGNLSGSWAFHDEDGDSEQGNETKWYNNSIEITALANLTWISSPNTSRGENWTFAVRVNDGYNWSSWANSMITIANSFPAAPGLNYPLTDQNTLAVNFDWNPSADDDNDPVNYNLQVSNSSSFIHLYLNHSLADTNYSASLNETTYWWRVLACDSEGCTSSANYSFAIDLSGPSINITSPTAGSTIANSYFTAYFKVNDSNMDKCLYNLTNSSGLVTSGSKDDSTYPNLQTNFSRLLNGQHNLTIFCNDTLGNSNTSSVLFNVNDTTRPTATITESQSGANPVTVTFTVTTNEPAVCKGDTSIWYGSGKDYAEMIYNLSTADSITHTQSIEYAYTTERYFYVKCNDSNGNLMASSTWKWFTANVQASTTSSSSSGGGGGGSGAYSPYSPISHNKTSSLRASQANSQLSDQASEENPTGAFHPAGSSEIFSGMIQTIGGRGNLSFDQRSMAITDIMIHIKEDKETWLEVRPLAQVTGVPRLDDTHQYLEIKTELTAEELKEVLITFKVPKEWIMDNNYTKIHLQRYAEESWQKLNTKLIKGDEQFAYYQAKSPGLSYFAITGEQKDQLFDLSGVKNIFGGAVSFFREINLPEWQLDGKKKFLIGLGSVLVLMTVVYLIVRRKEE